MLKITTNPGDIEIKNCRALANEFVTHFLIETGTNNIKKVDNSLVGFTIDGNNFIISFFVESFDDKIKPTEINVFIQDSFVNPRILFEKYKNYIEIFIFERTKLKDLGLVKIN